MQGNIGTFVHHWYKLFPWKLGNIYQFKTHIFFALAIAQFENNFMNILLYAIIYIFEDVDFCIIYNSKIIKIIQMLITRGPDL